MVRVVGCVEMTQKAAGAAGCCEFGGEQPLLPGDAWRDCKRRERGRASRGMKIYKKRQPALPLFVISWWRRGTKNRAALNFAMDPYWVRFFVLSRGSNTISSRSLYAARLRPADLGWRLNFASAFPKFRRWFRHRSSAGRQPRANIYFFCCVAARCERRSDVCRFLCSSRIKFLSGGCHSRPSLTGPCKNFALWAAPADSTLCSGLAVRKRRRQRQCDALRGHN